VPEPTRSTDDAIVTEQVVRRFGDNEAVAGVDLRVPKGEIFGFLGPNGAGKTTLTRVLCALLAPVRLRIGVALQSAALDDKQTGTEMLRLQGRFYGLSRQDTERRLGALRELIDIGDAIDDRVGTYSGGMKRRLDLALALIHTRRCCSSTSPRRDSIRRVASSCGRRSAASTTSSA